VRQRHHQVGDAEGNFIIGNVAALAPHKDYFTFVETAEILLRENVRATFLIVGAGPLEAEIRSFIRERSLERSVLVTGFRNDVPQVLRALDLFLITSKTEGLGTSVLDAFASGVPVVATRGGGLVELVVDGETGLLADVGNPAALAAQVTRLLNDEELARKVTSGAREKVREFDKSRTARETYEAYVSAVEGN
jgi:L-malate glycosyltransferase